MKKNIKGVTKIDPRNKFQKVLKPYRLAIDRIDDKILKLLGDRFAIIRTVAGIKINNDFPAFIGDRVEQVRDRATAQAVQYGMDPDFIRTLYTVLIYQSCATEDLIKQAHRKKLQQRKEKKKKRK